MLGAPEMNVLWKVVSGKTNLRQKSFGNTRSIKSFLLSERLLQSATAQHCEKYILTKFQDALLPHLTAMWLLGLDFMLTSQVCMQELHSPLSFRQMATVSISYKRRKIAFLKTVQQLDNFTIRELCCPLENYLNKGFLSYIVVVHITVS